MNLKKWLADSAITDFEDTSVLLLDTSFYIIWVCIFNAFIMMWFNFLLSILFIIVYLIVTSKLTKSYYNYWKYLYTNKILNDSKSI